MFGNWVDFAEAVVGVSVSGEDWVNGRIVGAEEEVPVWVLKNCY